MDLVLKFEKPSEVSSYNDDDILEIVFKSEVLFYDENAQALSYGSKIQRRLP